ncbi:unnamed protein product [Brassicogethes aeneus]|uniref:Major facilitator superfamily (MFS) profile domain-containing protein n=1 Tax=Brassicogethes aeneus TaxID=1431903 RepID=A0A9P0BA71_BRAAE|nr:unnamed protein product [Brassicogethes aeneus]
MASTGFMVNFMLRVNISIAIVDMIEHSNITSNYTRFNWTPLQKNEILGIFYWGYTASVLVGGRLSEIYGTRLIFGNGIFLASITTIFFPLCCKVDYYLALVARFLMGIFLGVLFSSILPIAVHWVPPLDRSKFSSNLMAQGLGVAITLPVCGYLITYLGWESVFYSTGAVGLIWSITWYFTIYDSPDLHPRISFEEKSNIKNRMVLEVVDKGKKPKKVPWKSILTSLPVWSIMIAQNGNTFYLFPYINQLPTYMNDVLNLKISDNGLFSCLPFIGQYAFACIGCYIADKLRKSKQVSTKTTRKIFIAFAFFIPSTLMLILGCFKLHYLIAISILTLIHSFKGCISASYIANAMDIAPNFTGTLFGISMVMGSMTGWVGNKMVGLLTKEVSDFETWRTVFITIALVSSAGGFFFFVFVSGDVQKWNQEENDEEDLDIEPLKASILPKRT